MSDEQTDKIGTADVHEIISVAGQVVAQGLHQLVQQGLEQGVEAGIAKFHEMYPLVEIPDDRLEALLRREICRGMRDRAATAAEAWDDVLFRLSNEQGGPL